MNQRSLLPDNGLHRFDDAEPVSQPSPCEAYAKVVYVIEADEECRASISQLVHNMGYVAVEFTSAELFLQYERPGVTDCMIVDQELSGMTGLELQDVLASRGDSIPIIFIWGIPEVVTVVQAIRNGAVTMLEKPVRSETLRSALQEAFYGATPPVREVHQRFAESFRNVQLVHRLSPREREVAAMVADGFSNKQIAGTLGLSEKTIEKYRSNCVRKLNAKSSAEMVRTIVTAEILGVS